MNEEDLEMKKEDYEFIFEIVENAVGVEGVPKSVIIEAVINEFRELENVMQIEIDNAKEKYKANRANLFEYLKNGQYIETENTTMLKHLLGR